MIENDPPLVPKKYAVLLCPLCGAVLNALEVRRLGPLDGDHEDAKMSVPFWRYVCKVCGPAFAFKLRPLEKV